MQKVDYDCTPTYPRVSGYSYGSRIDRGLVESLDEIPEGYTLSDKDDEDSPSRIYIEPYSKQDL